MSKRSKRKKAKSTKGSSKAKKSTSGSTANVVKESQGAEAMTVAWLLCLLATIVAVVLALVGRWMYWHDPNDQTGMASGVLTFSSVVTGVLTLVLTAVVIRARKIPPPDSVVRLAIGVGVLPFLVWGLTFLLMGPG